VRGGLFGETSSRAIHFVKHGVVTVADGGGRGLAGKFVYNCVAVALGGAMLRPAVLSGVRAPRCLYMSRLALCLLRRPR